MRPAAGMLGRHLHAGLRLFRQHLVMTPIASSTEMSVAPLLSADRGASRKSLRRRISTQSRSLPAFRLRIPSPPPPPFCQGHRLVAYALRNSCCGTPPTQYDTGNAAGAKVRGSHRCGLSFTRLIKVPGKGEGFWPRRQRLRIVQRGGGVPPGYCPAAACNSAGRPWRWSPVNRHGNG